MLFLFPSQDDVECPAVFLLVVSSCSSTVVVVVCSSFSIWFCCRVVWMRKKTFAACLNCLQITVKDFLHTFLVFGRKDLIGNWLDAGRARSPVQKSESTCRPRVWITKTSIGMCTFIEMLFCNMFFFFIDHLPLISVLFVLS